MVKLLISILTFAVLLSPALAANRSLYWDSIQTDIYINDDSSLSMVEKLDYVFTGEWNGGYRSINLKGLDEISNVELWEDKLQYIEGNLEKYHFTAGKKNSRLEIKWRSRNADEPPYRETRKKFIIKYRVEGALNYQDSHDELYWKAIFAEREGVVKQGRAIVHFPSKVDPARLKVALYTGAPNAAWRIADGHTVVFAGSNLAPGEPFEVQVKFPAGVIVRKFSANKFINQRFSPFVIAFFPSLAFLIMLYLYLRFGRDYGVKDIKRPLEHKPSDLPPALAGTLVDERADIKEILATLVDLARRGYLEISELELKLLKQPLNLLAYEIKLIEDLFGIPLILDSRVRTADLKDKFYIHVDDLKNAIYDETIKLGYFVENPRAVRSRFLLFGIFILILGLIPLAISFFADWLEASSFLVTGGLGVSVAGLVVAAFSGAMPRKTLLGSREKIKWLAFRKYLASGPPACLPVGTAGEAGKKTEKFEEYAPYAVAFGITTSFDSMIGDIGSALTSPAPDGVRASSPASVDTR